MGERVQDRRLRPRRDLMSQGTHGLHQAARGHRAVRTRVSQACRLLALLYVGSAFFNSTRPTSQDVRFLMPTHSTCHRAFGLLPGIRRSSCHLCCSAQDALSRYKYFHFLPYSRASSPSSNPFTHYKLVLELYPSIPSPATLSLFTQP